jgi:hypothetical protein
MAREFGFDFQQGVEISLFITKSRLDYEATELPTQWVKQPWFNANHSPTSSKGQKNNGATPPKRDQSLQLAEVPILCPSTFFPAVLQPNAGHTVFILKVSKSHTTMHHSWYDSSV